MKKDKVFIIVISIVIANLSYQLLYELMSGLWMSSVVTWFVMIGDIIGIGGGLYLVKNYRKMRKIDKMKELMQAKNEEDNKVS